MPAESAKLTPKQRLFVREYLKDLNGTQAAIRAGYSKKSANVIAAQNLAKLNVKLAIQQQYQRREKAVEIDAQRVLQEIAAGAFFDPGELFTAQGKAIPIPQLPEHVRRGFTTIDVATGEDGKPVLSYRVQKQKNQELLAKHKKLLTDKFEIDAGQTLEAIIAQSMKRPSAKKQ